MQVAIDKQLKAEHRDQIGKGPAECRLQLQVAQHEHRDQGRPDLRVDRVRSGTQERLDLQILFYRFKQRTDILPTKLCMRKS